VREDIIRINAEIRPIEWSRWLKKTLDVVFNQDKILFKKAVAARCNGPSGQKYVAALLKVVVKSQQWGTSWF
jgi:hypothetical protein